MNIVLLVIVSVLLLLVPSGVSAEPDPSAVHTVQVVAARSREEALRVMKGLQRRGDSPFMLDIYDRQGILWHTVHAARFKNLRAAKVYAAKLSGKKGKSAVVLSLPEASFDNFRRRSETWMTEETDRNSSVAAKAPLLEKKVIQPPIVTANLIPEGGSRLSNQADISSRESHGRYIMANMGVFRTEKSSDDLNRDLTDHGFTANSSIDRTNLAWKLVGGYKFTQILGVEAGFVRMQKINTRIDASNTSGLVGEAARHAPLTMDGVIVEGVASWDVTPLFSLIGKAGGFLWRGKVSASGPGEQIIRRDDGVDFVFGVGADYDLWDRAWLRVEWERFLTPDGGDLVTAGLGVAF
ncbi:MAG: TonB-dependent receptor [Magnetococcales bacterium]|nr:TonB-dependent receptor [Magnetococcales bacterium]HIJ83267.1 hypothetical protein [Magnetococcales bacterium]